MTSEWLQIMLDEIARKKADAEQARIEEERRAGDGRGMDVNGVVVESERCAPRNTIGDAE